MDIKRWKEFLAKGLGEDQTTKEVVVENGNPLTEILETETRDQVHKILNKESLTEAMNADQVAAKTRSYLLKIADDIIALTALLDQNESDELKEKLIAALPQREPKNSDFVDAFMALDTIGAQKVAKYYRELAKNLK